LTATKVKQPKIQKPPAIQPGAKIAVLSLASSFKPELLPVGLDALATLGFVPLVGQHTSSKARPYFAGTPKERLRDLHDAFASPEVATIICTRGGYGSNYLMQGLDLELITKHPKPLFAYSDMTNLQSWLLDQAGLPAFHGPMLTADFAVQGGVDLPSFLAALSGRTYQLGHAEGMRVLKPGTARGTLYGGCLSILVASLGTPYAVQTEGKVLFIEDVGVKPYQIDRMLRQMILAGKLEGVAGIVFGEMLDCISPGADPLLIEEVVLSVLRDFAGPIGIGLRSGHVSRGNVTLAFGINVELDLTETPTLRFLETATQK
jgi:muramoyltetrapeptide carboxypeptidase